MLRKNLIKHKIEEMIINIKIVENNLPRTFNEFKDLGLIKDGIYKRIENSIEKIIDICNILNTDLGLKIPSSEDDIIKNLEEKKIFSEKVIAKINEMKGFRNVLVHKYNSIDDENAFHSIKQALVDFNLFNEEVNWFLTRYRNRKG